MCYLQELVVKKTESHSDSVESLDLLEKHEKFLKGLAKDKNIEAARINELCETLIELASKKVNITALKHSNIQELLKVVSVVCSQSDTDDLKKLGGVIEILRKHWKEILKPKKIEYNENAVVNRSLRSIVCRKIAGVLEGNNFERDEARSLAVSIEEKIRKMDPTMTHKYKSCFKMMIKDIKKINISIYNEMKKY